MIHTVHTRLHRAGGRYSLPGDPVPPACLVVLDTATGAEVTIGYPGMAGSLVANDSAWWVSPTVSVPAPPRPRCLLLACARAFHLPAASQTVLFIAGTRDRTRVALVSADAGGHQPAAAHPDCLHLHNHLHNQALITLPVCGPAATGETTTLVTESSTTFVGLSEYST